MHNEPRSKFAKMLAADPELAARCEEVVKKIREAAKEEIEACERSRMIGPDDNVYINARLSLFLD